MLNSEYRPVERSNPFTSEWTLDSLTAVRAFLVTFTKETNQKIIFFSSLNFAKRMKNLSSNIGVLLWYLCIDTIVSTGLIPRMMNVTDKCHSENVCDPGALLSPGPPSSQNI